MVRVTTPSWPRAISCFCSIPRLSQKVLEEYRPRTVWMPPLDAAQVESLNYRYVRNPYLLEKAESNWQVVGKPDTKINASTVEDTLGALASLKLSRYVVDKDANLTLFGLDKPTLILEAATCLATARAARRQRRGHLERSLCSCRGLRTRRRIPIGQGIVCAAIT